MKVCLNCKKEYQNKRDTSKFCSDKCRVKYNRDNPQKTVSKFQMQVLYNNILAAVESIGAKNDLPSPFGGVIHPEPAKAELTQRWLTKADKEALKLKYVDERREFTCEDEHRDWHKRVDSDERLNKEDKIQVKNTR